MYCNYIQYIYICIAIIAPKNIDKYAHNDKRHDDLGFENE